MASVAILVANNSCTGFRWFIIAKRLDVDVKLNEVLKITHQAGLFVYFLPAQLSIDILRVAKFKIGHLALK